MAWQGEEDETLGIDSASHPVRSLLRMPAPLPDKEGLYDLENSIGYLLNRAGHLIAARFSDELKLHDISVQSWRILAALSQAGNQSMSELADHTGAELSYLTRLVATLEKQDYLERQPSPLDKRATLISLTPTGWAVVRQLSPKASAIQCESVANVPQADLEATLRTLRAVSQNLVAGLTAPAGVNRKLTIARRVKKRARNRQEEPAGSPEAQPARRSARRSDHS